MPRRRQGQRDPEGQPDWFVEARAWVTGLGASALITTSVVPPAVHEREVTGMPTMGPPVTHVEHQPHTAEGTAYLPPPEYGEIQTAAAGTAFITLEDIPPELREAAEHIAESLRYPERRPPTAAAQISSNTPISRIGPYRLR